MALLRGYAWPPTLTSLPALGWYTTNHRVGFRICSFARHLCVWPNGSSPVPTVAEPSYTHAGMLMALGLTGHLRCGTWHMCMASAFVATCHDSRDVNPLFVVACSCLAATDLYRYLAQEHDATIIGVLLGMAASKRCPPGMHAWLRAVCVTTDAPRAVCRASQDATISKTLFLHLPTRHPSSYPELDISPLVQAAALAGVGLLFQGTCHRYTRAACFPGRRGSLASSAAPVFPCLRLGRGGSI